MSMEHPLNSLNDVEWVSPSPMYHCLGAVYTYAGVVENHTGMEKIGTERDGLTFEDLTLISDYLQSVGYTVELIDLRSRCDASGSLGLPRAHVLRVQGWNENDVGLLRELMCVRPDKKFYNTRRKIVQNKNARYNFNVADFDQAPDYALGKGTVVNFARLPKLTKIRNMLTAVGRATGLDKLENLLAEANVYHSENSGIGFHGDSERCMVIGVNMGEERVIEFQSFKDALPAGSRVSLKLRNNDMYFMCETACGHTWNKGCYRLPHYRHRAGYPKWLSSNSKQNERKWAKMRAKRAPAEEATTTTGADAGADAGAAKPQKKRLRQGGLRTAEDGTKHKKRKKHKKPKFNLDQFAPRLCAPVCDDTRHPYIRLTEQ